MKSITSSPKISCKNGQVKNAALIYEYAHQSASSLLQAFGLAQKTSGRKRGMTSDLEQDILRAMFVMGSAGFDSSLKQLIRDALPVLALKSSGVQDGLEKFLQKKIRGDELEFGVEVKFLAKVLATPSSHSRIVEEYVRELAGDSLQSVEQLFTVAAAFGLESKKLGLDPNVLRPIFQARNVIVHEMDMDLTGTRRKRNIRGIDEMVSFTDSLLDACQKILIAVDNSL